MSPSRSDTIFARASGAGKAGVAVYRVSGPDAHSIATQLIGKKIKNREAVLTYLRDPSDDTIIDRGLTITFQGPASFTGEDSVEFHLHGSHAVEHALYDVLNRLGGRPAEAGEFTLRALKNGKLDLAQAEALADLIDAETSAQRQQALGQLAGRLSTLAEDWRHRILTVLAPLEADIDFPDEGDVPAAIAAAAGPAIVGLKDQLTEFLAQSGRARRIREGVSIAVVGPPNAGKSSLVNALAGSEIAIVSDIAGTTRDVVETRLDLGGIVANLADTAGLRADTGDAIEKEGVKRARAKAEAATIRIGVLDPTSTINDQDAVALLRRNDFLIWSKADLETVIPSAQVPDGVRVMALSSKTGLGMAGFVDALTRAVSGGSDQGDEPALTRARHVQAVDEAIEALSRAEAQITTAPELAAEDARLAARALGQITGAVGVEDILGEIFSSFCIGK